MALQYTALGLCVKDQARNSMISLVILALYVLSGCIPCGISAMPIRFQIDLLQGQASTGNGPDCLISERLKLDSRFDTPG